MSSTATTKRMPRTSKPFCFSIPLLLQTTLMLITMLLLLMQVNDCDAVTEVPVRPFRHLSSADPKTHQFSAEQKMALQQVIRTMMGFGREVPPMGHPMRQPDGGGNPSSVGHQTAPRYMHRLYEKYRVAEAVGMPHEMADTVRNINPDLAIVNNGSLFVFNLTSLLEAETVLRAEIHIYKRRLKVSSPSAESTAVDPPHASAEPGFIVVTVYELGPRILRERASFRLPDAGHFGWHTFDVTSAIKSCSSTQRSGATPRMLALSFSFDDDGSRSSNGKMLLSKFVRKLSRPFLMVFSQENHNNSLDAQLDSLFRRGNDRPVDRSAVEEDSWRWDYDNPLLSHGRFLVGRKNKPAFRSRVVWSSPSEVRGSRRQNLSDEIFVMESSSGAREVPDLGWNTTGKVLQKYAVEEEAIGGLARGKFYHAGFSPDAENVPAKSLSYQRRKRQVVADNEIPQEVTSADPEPVPPVLYNLPKTNPGILRGRSRTGRKDQPSTARPAVEFGVEEKVEESPKRQGKGRAGEGASLSVLLPRPHGRKKAGRAGEKREGASEVCGKRKLVVDFADIGWSQWIISPKSFEAHYCDGLCAYPMAPRLRPTNHATIQSIVKAIGLQTEVPSPCCIPASLSSVTLLYFDQNQNVVLKNYPDMTVRSCACR